MKTTHMVMSLYIVFMDHNLVPKLGNLLTPISYPCACSLRGVDACSPDPSYRNSGDIKGYGYRRGYNRLFNPQGAAYAAALAALQGVASNPRRGYRSYRNPSLFYFSTTLTSLAIGLHLSFGSLFFLLQKKGVVRSNSSGGFFFVRSFYNKSHSHCKLLVIPLPLGQCGGYPPLRVSRS